ncbi:MAG: macro domain-containing protein, partial [Proteobacteria bacterium]|nr:macro domain-containing protein [Pseudomonadota bacterium]
GAIHRAAGHAALQELCLAIIRDIGQLETGKAVITDGLALPARHIIHTVGPIWRGGTHDEAHLLSSAYRSCLQLAHEHHIQSIAFPAISCGAYGYPLDKAIPIALAALRTGLKEGLVRLAQMVLHGEKSYRAWVACGEIVL